jgi:hypothetical protein
MTGLVTVIIAFIVPFAALLYILLWIGEGS